MLPTRLHKNTIAKFLSERTEDSVRLRPAKLDDSEFLLGLRLDPSRNQNISETNGELGAQLSWMQAYEMRESEGIEAYFVIEVDGLPSGCLRLYDYRISEDSFSWGSWIIKPGAPPTAAYQSAILIYDLAFGALRFSRSHFDVRKANVSVWKFHEKMGAKMVHEDTRNRFYEYAVEDYRSARRRLQKFTQSRDF